MPRQARADGKPPTTTISELDDIVAYARKKKRILFQTWHSRYNRCVDKVQKLIKREGRQVGPYRLAQASRKWHPSRDWVWEPGGFGVFDPGINAPLDLHQRSSRSRCSSKASRLAFPSNAGRRSMRLKFPLRPAAPARHERAGFNWLRGSGEIWTIRVETSGRQGRSVSSKAVAARSGSMAVVDQHGDDEYAQIYAPFPSC